MILRTTLVATAALLALGAAQATGRTSQIGYFNPATDGRTPTTGNNPADDTPSVQDWRVTQTTTFNGVNFDGNVRINFDGDGSLANGGFVCSGTLLKGGQYVLTAAHCADDSFNPATFVMEIRSGIYGNVAATTQSISAANVFVHPGWNGSLGTGADIAVIKLTTPITGITGFNISTTNDVGKTMLIMGHGTTQLGNVAAATNWNDYGWAHYGYNQADVTDKAFNDAWDGSGDNTFGEGYVFDFDALSNAATHNTIQRLADQGGASFTSSEGLGIPEAITAGGDSGGGDFVWTGTEWLVSGVHSWGWQFCGGRITPTCDLTTRNSSSWGDISGSTATFSHVQWITSITGPIPEPGTYGLMALGLLAVAAAARRRG
jgi:secreted trypsin-like serine protease